MDKNPKEKYELALAGLPIPFMRFKEQEWISQVLAMDLFPHLNHQEKEEAGKILLSHKPVALPPLLIRGAYQELKIYGGDDLVVEAERMRGSFPYMQWEESCFSQMNSWRKKRPPVAFVEQAVRYAEEAWRNDLIPDTFETIITFRLRDPTVIEELYHRSYLGPKFIISLTLGLSKRIRLPQFNGKRNLVESKRISQEIGDSVIVITKDYHHQREMWGEVYLDRGYTLDNCILCLNGLGKERCLGCRKAYKLNGANSWFDVYDVALPDKVAYFLKEEAKTRFFV